MKHLITILLKRTAKLIPLWGVVTIGLVFFSPLLGDGGLLAQTPVPGGGANAGAPLDGFTTLLLAAGVGYGTAKIVKKTRDKSS